MKKILLLALIGAGLVAFVGTDVVKGALTRARDGIRETLTADVPLRTQLAEAQKQIDVYAESVIHGEVAADNLAEMIGTVRREVAGLDARVSRERTALVAMKRGLEVVPTSTAPTDEEREALRQARIYQAHAQLLERRRQDLERLKKEHENTLASLEQAKAEQARLAQEVQVLAAEIESVEARTAAARTREAVGESAVSSSGYAEARQRLRKIENEVKERNKLLQYYEFERRPVSASPDASLEDVPGDARTAIDQALAQYPGR